MPNAKNPGTIKSTEEAQVDVFARSPPVAATTLTCCAIGPIKETPIRILTNPPIKFAIMFCYVTNEC